MRFSKREDGKGGRREERRRVRERAREARRRRQELERRAAEMQSRTAETAESAPARTAEPAPVETKPRSEKKPVSKRRRQKPESRRRPLREVGRRLSLARAGKLLAPTGRALAQVGRYLAALILVVAALIERLARRLVAVLGPPLSRAVSALGRLATPTRAAILVAAAAGLAVLAAQAMDYRAVAIGGDAYAEVASLAQAPLAEHRTPWSVHGPLVGLLAIVATVGVILTLRGQGRRARLGALAASGAGLLVILGFDLTKAADLGEATAEYAGADAVLLEGFYIELGAMLMLGLFALLPSLWNRKAS